MEDFNVEPHETSLKEFCEIYNLIKHSYGSDLLQKPYKPFDRLSLNYIMNYLKGRLQRTKI